MLGLHAADQEACNYYRYLNSQRDAPLFRDEINGVTGVPPREAEARDKPYFETHLSGALELLQDYYDG